MKRLFPFQKMQNLPVTKQHVILMPLQHCLMAQYHTDKKLESAFAYWASFPFTFFHNARIVF